MKRGILLTLAFSLLGSPALACEYFAWVNYGPAAKDAYADGTEQVYHSSGVMKLESGFKAVYSEVGETHHVSGSRIRNLGPYENEAVAERALNEFIEELEGRGFEEASSRHDLPEVIEKNKTSCE